MYSCNSAKNYAIISDYDKVMYSTNIFCNHIAISHVHEQQNVWSLQRKTHNVCVTEEIHSHSSIIINNLKTLIVHRRFSHMHLMS